MMKKLWNDEVGALVSAEIILVATILVIGVVTGLSSVRTAVVTELGDVASAIGSVDQSYSVGGTTGHHSITSAFSWTDGVDACDESCGQVGNSSACLQICTSGKLGETAAAPN